MVSEEQHVHDTTPCRLHGTCALVARLGATFNATVATLLCSQAAQAQSSPTFNPNVYAILSGTYANLQKNPESWRIKGFVPAGDEIGPGERGFNLGETELGLNAMWTRIFTAQSPWQ